MGLGGWILERMLERQADGAHITFNWFIFGESRQGKHRGSVHPLWRLTRKDLMKRREKMHPREALYTPLARNITITCTKPPQNLSEVKTPRSDHHCIIHPIINLSYTHTSVYAKNDVKKRKRLL